MSDEIHLYDLKSQHDGLKWAEAGPGVIPAWVADMDLPTAPEVIQALQRRAEGDLGYPAWLLSQQCGPLAEAFAERMATRYGWEADPVHVRSYNDLNQALQVLLHVWTRPGDGVAVHTPAYHPFLDTLAIMERPLHAIQMRPEGESWWFEVPDLSGCRVLLLVNPHNPTGRVFTREELERLAEHAERHDLLVISDEIHADLVYDPYEHIPFATILPDRTVTLTSATKAFNLGGIRCSVAHIGSPEMREALDGQPPFVYGSANLFGVEATVAAWRHGDAWLRETLALLDRNRWAIAERLPPTVGYRVPEATYLAWLDYGRPGMAEVLKQEAKVLLSDGALFGPGGDTHVRLNFATTEPILTEILNRLNRAG
ncbi:MalY/PatB family protein [Nonomuraea cavernae]|uniref:cysteine-S-conjugate beta-lyase n=1 Tax=Nonomuraea cavernae TaxID=2045107 RepID=A0A917Z7L9_9ACTN|nr:aminotransferase class I/II-fold pyridoxal phosphate-dependent enzyme [Nonomuraea cavernae]MCA2189621.1 aminotransferase class I/II-fold pyridoxal phosphate-dependent enzyme [Nonomuraea cavernae]GGO77333.1 aminotransferase [Nonomuraea cavernae]